MQLRVAPVATGERSQYRNALEVSRRALATVLPTGDAGLESEARIRLGQTLVALGEYRAAADELRQIRDADPPDGVSPPVPSSTLAVLWLVRCLAETGDLSGAMREVDRAFGIAEERHHPYTLAFAFTYLGLVELFSGDAAAATRALEHSRSLCAEGHYSALAPMAASLLGSARLLAGSLEEALPLLRESVDAAARFRASWLINLGAGLLEAKELDEAERCARSALEEARQLGDRGTVGWALRLFAEVAARSVGADAAEVEARYGEAQALGEELGMLPLVAQCHRGLAEFLRRRGRLAEAARCFTAAAGMFRDMGAPAWAERTLDQARAGSTSTQISS